MTLIKVPQFCNRTGGNRMQKAGESVQRGKQIMAKMRRLICHLESHL